jgi:NAD(P)-dependent dehydrogenase (short-subunit alcohol dehydrogenase family)/Na+/H+-dicarboxylate symporter
MSSDIETSGQPSGQDFTGRVVIVTGAWRGLGRAAAERFHERGAAVAVNVRDRARSENLAASLGGDTLAVPGDIAAPGIAEEIVRMTLERFGRVDILVNNAALALSTRFPDLTAEEWRSALEVNLTAPFLLTKAVLPAMQAQQYGRIINISSSAGRMVSTLGGAHYTASKAGLLGFTRAAAKELGKFGITVNAVCPGMIDTELTRENANDELLQRLAASYPIPRIGTAREVADLICFAASESAGYITGAALDINRWRLDDVMKEGTRVLLALVAGILIGVAIAASHNASLIRFADAIAPIGTLWVNAIRMTVIPLVVSLLITGVASVSDIKSIGRLGGRTILTFVLLLIGVAALVVPIAPAIFALLPPHGPLQLPAGAVEAAKELSEQGQAQTFSTWLVSLLPANPVAAAANGAMMPLILFTLLLALAIARSPETSRETLTRFFRALSEAMLILVRWIILAAPLGIFALVLPLAVHAGAMLAGAIGFYVVAYSVVSIVVTLLLYPVVAIFGRIPMRRFARGALPPQLIAFSSSSSIASLPALIETAEKNLGLPKRVTGFVLPLAVSTFKIAGPVSWPIGALFCRLVLRCAVERGKSGDDRFRHGVPRFRCAGYSAGRIHHVDAALSCHRLAAGRNRNPHRRGRNS